MSIFRQSTALSLDRKRPSKQGKFANAASRAREPGTRLHAGGKRQKQQRQEAYARNSKARDACIATIEQLSSQEDIAEYALTDCDPVIRLAAVKCLTDQQSLGTVAREDPNAIIRMEALRHLTDDAIRMQIAAEDVLCTIRIEAARGIQTPSCLAVLAEEAEDSAVRKEAIKALEALQKKRILYGTTHRAKGLRMAADDLEAVYTRYHHADMLVRQVDQRYIRKIGQRIHEVYGAQGLRDALNLINHRFSGAANVVSMLWQGI